MITLRMNKTNGNNRQPTHNMQKSTSMFGPTQNRYTLLPKPLLLSGDRQFPHDNDGRPSLARTSNDVLKIYQCLMNMTMLVGVNGR